MTKSEPQDSWHIGPIKDARGRSVTQLDPVVMHLMHKHDAIPADALLLIARQVGIGMTRWNRVLFWASILCVICLVTALTILLVRYFNGTISGGRFVRSLIPFAFIWFTPYGLWMGTRGVRFQRIRKVMLEHRRCPHCGYDLRGLPTDADGHATLYPECGSAWRLDMHEHAERKVVDV